MAKYIVMETFYYVIIYYLIYFFVCLFVLLCFVYKTCIGKMNNINFIVKFVVQKQYKTMMMLLKTFSHLTDKFIRKYTYMYYVCVFVCIVDVVKFL